MGSIEVARVYDEVGIGADPAHRFLVDRLWPRGLAKADAPFSAWVKDVAPSTELRRWYGHAEERFEEFADRYRRELQSPSGERALSELRDLIGGDDAVLLTATKELSGSHAVILRQVLVST